MSNYDLDWDSFQDKVDSPQSTLVSDNGMTSENYIPSYRGEFIINSDPERNLPVTEDISGFMFDPKTGDNSDYNPTAGWQEKANKMKYNQSLSSYMNSTSAWNQREAYRQAAYEQRANQWELDRQEGLSNYYKNVWGK